MPHLDWLLLAIGTCSSQLLSSDSHPSEGDDVAAGDCQNLVDPQNTLESCESYCNSLPTCTAFWFYDSGSLQGRCCPKASYSADMATWRSVNDGAFYAFKQELSVQSCDASSAFPGNYGMRCPGCSLLQTDSLSFYLPWVPPAHYIECIIRLYKRLSRSWGVGNGWRRTRQLDPGRVW